MGSESLGSRVSLAGCPACTSEFGFDAIYITMYLETSKMTKIFLLSGMTVKKTGSYWS